MSEVDADLRRLKEFNDQLCAENDRLLEQRTALIEALEDVAAVVVAALAKIQTEGAKHDNN